MVTPVGNFIQKDFPTTYPYVGINLIQEQLLEYSAIVVLDEDTNDFLGVLTPRDIVTRRHNLVIDCFTDKGMLNFECSVEESLEAMNIQNTEVLPVAIDNKFDGLVFKDDLISFLSFQYTKRGKQLMKSKAEIEKSEKILKGIYDSTNSVRFLVAPDYTILFFNKKAQKNVAFLRQKELKIGDSLKEYAKDALNGIDNHLEQDFEKALLGKYVTRENEVRCEDASFWFKTEYHPVYINRKLIGVSINTTDISDKKKNEVFISNQNKALRDIIVYQSHEVRRPVSNILGLINLLKDTQSYTGDKEIIQLLEQTTNELDAIIKVVVEKAFLRETTDSEIHEITS